ncbi:MAG TPA: PIG-L family deacetylase [Anaerolineaceae bacterium]|jgi:LmbE family N-acetylglucosaminyl deacetylase|nr:PIG-L family deacetylase [Anaerolineaceae bacterium]
MSETNIENWQEKQKILVFLAHPDDPEFFCGAMIARWVSLGHELHYCLLTQGQKGAQSIDTDPERLAVLRRGEQRNAADVLGVKSVSFLNYVDGEVYPSDEMRREIVRVIREIRPTILVTSDPRNLFPSDRRINHPDHRAAGQAVVDAAFPAAGNPCFYPELIREEDLAPHSVKEVWLSATSQPNLVIDLTGYFEKKLAAIHCHKSQIGTDLAEFDRRMHERFVKDDLTGEEKFYEQFFRIILG